MAEKDVQTELDKTSPTDSNRMGEVSRKEKTLLCATAGEWLKEEVRATVYPDQLGLTEEMNRTDRIRESYTLLRPFTSKELKILMNLKRNTSQKAWTLREDLIVLSLPLSNREIAEVLVERNKEAVKKRLQLLKSKGLHKRLIEVPPPETYQVMKKL